MNYFIIYWVWITIYALNYDQNGYNFEKYSFATFLIEFVCKFLLFSIDLILTIIITYLFCRNLILLAASIKNTKRTVSSKKAIKYKEDVELTETKSACSPSITIRANNTLSAKIRLFTSTASTSLLSSSTETIKYEYETTQIDGIGEIYLNGKQKRLICLTVRLIVLTVPAMISTSFVWISSMIAWYLGYFEDETIFDEEMQSNDHYLYWMLRVIIIPMDTILNFLCVYLAFDFAAQYYSWLCLIHNLCYNCFKRAVKRRIAANNG